MTLWFNNIKDLFFWFVLSKNDYTLYIYHSTYNKYLLNLYDIKLKEDSSYDVRVKDSVYLDF